MTWALFVDVGSLYRGVRAMTGYWTAKQKKSVEVTFEKNSVNRWTPG